MKAWNIYCSLLLLLCPASTRGDDDDDTVAGDIGIHQLERLVEMLTEKECEDLLSTLSEPEENVFKHFERLSPERNQLEFKPRDKRDAPSADDEEECQVTLTEWLLKNGKKIYYDRLTRALQRIGRTDIAIEVGKSINQDKILNMKRHIEEYHKYVESLNIPSVPSDEGDSKPAKKGIMKRRVADLGWCDTDLIVEQAPLPLYPKGPLSVVLPLLYGILLGFSASFLACLSVLFFITQLFRINPPRRQHGNAATSNYSLLIGCHK